MKKMTILLILCVLTISLISQNIKSYTGLRSISILNFIVDGTETYKYVEKSGEKIRIGPYSFTKEIKRSNYNSYTGQYEERIATISITGNYANGKPDKTWNAKIMGGINSTEMNLNSTCTYENGMLNGKFSSRIEVQEYNKKGIMVLTECTFKNNKIVGKYLLRAGTKGTTSPDYTRSAEFDKNGFITNEYYKNGFDLNERYIPTYDTSLNALFFNDTLFLTENKGYIDLNSGLFYDVSGIENDCFMPFQTGYSDLIMIFQVTADLPKIYVTRRWIVPEEIEVEALINEFNENGFTNKAKKLEYYFNLSQGFKLANEEQYKKSKSHYLKSLEYKDGTEVRNKINELQTLIEFDSLYLSAFIEFKKNQFDDAKLLYLKALTIKPDNRIDDMLVKIKDIDNKYSEYINIAETKYKKGNPELSKVNFKLALSVKPNEQYPRDFIQRIDDEKYDKLVKTGENEYKNENFEISKSNFQEALTVKPNEKYANDYIRRIDNENIRTCSAADSLFLLNDFDNALLNYKQSLKYNSDNKKSKLKIKNIESTKNAINEVNIKIEKRKIELEPELGRLLKKVFISINTYYDNKINAEKDIFVVLPIKNELFEVINKLKALEVTKDKEIQKQLRDVETPQEYLKILGF